MRLLCIVSYLAFTLVILVQSSEADDVDEEEEEEVLYTKWLTSTAEGGFTFIEGRQIERSIPVGVVIIHEAEPEGLLKGSKLVEHCNQTQQALICSTFNRHWAGSNKTADCDMPFTPKCSCTQMCGTMLLVPYISLTRDYMKTFIEQLAAKIPKLAKNGENMAIVHQDCDVMFASSSSGSCHYLLQILSPLPNDPHLRDFSAILRREMIRVSLVTSSKETLLGGPGSYLFVFTVLALGVPSIALLLVLVVIFFRRAMTKMERQRSFDLELLYNDDTID